MIDKETDNAKELEKKKWLDFLYFAFKKAKHFVTRETSFVDNVEIIKFEEQLDNNIEKLSNILVDREELKAEIKNMQGYLYFYPKSFGPNKEPRFRPKVAFPFEYQVIWAAVILRIGEWFDTNGQLKNTYSMRDEQLRKKLDWMVPWSFNGRIKRFSQDEKDDVLKPGYIKYNDSRLYEGHQLALKKYHTFQNDVIEQLFTYKEKIYRADLDIHEFFPTLKRTKIKKAFKGRLDSLAEVEGFGDRYFKTNEIEEIINVLLDLEITYPDTAEEGSVNYSILEGYYQKLVSTRKGMENKSTEEKELSNEFTIKKMMDLLNKTLPLDLIASNFLSNCTLNHFIDNKIGNKSEESNLYIMRYTDDYTVISNDKEEIKKTIDNIKGELEKIGLSHSYEKSLPTRTKDISEKLEIINLNNNWGDRHFEEIKKWFDIDKYCIFNKLLKASESELSESDRNLMSELKRKSLMLGINIEPEVILKNDINKDLTISKLSSTEDIKLLALSDKELSIYIRELMVYMKAKGDVGELQEETAKIFAAWRLNASYQEQTYRESYNLEEIKGFLGILEEVMVVYPYKLGYYNIYSLLLLNLIEHDDTGYEELEEFLLKINGILSDSSNVDNTDSRNSNTIRFITSCFPAIRIRILHLISLNWGRFEESKRVSLRSILEKVFIDWYADPRVNWEELYTMYSTFFIMRIRLPLGIWNPDMAYPIFILEMEKAYNEYFFITKSEKKNKENVNHKLRENYSQTIAIDLFKKGLYWDRDKRKYIFNDIDELIYKNIKNEILNKIGNKYNWLSIAKVAPDKIKTEYWCSLKAFSFRIKEEEFVYEIYDFVQGTIQLYFENPEKYKTVFELPKEKGTKEAAKSNSTEIIDSTDCIILQYIKERFTAFSKIRSYFSLTDERYAPLGNDNQDADGEVSVMDWVFYCQTLPYHLELNSSKQKVLHPLTEYEFIKLWNLIVSKNENMKTISSAKDSNGNNLVNKPKSPLFECKMDAMEWKEFRMGIQANQEDYSKNKVNDSEESNLGLSETDTVRNVRLLFSLLTSRPWHPHVKKGFSMYKWNDLQSYFELSYYPSTAVASLFVNHLNIHQDFYSLIYNMPMEELPYRDVYTKGKSVDLNYWVKDYLENQRDNLVYKADNRKLELLVIEIDPLRG